MNEKCIVYGIEVSIAAFSYDPEDPYIIKIVKDFNEYAKENNLDIQLNNILLSSHNTTVLNVGYASTVETWLRKKQTDYDIFTMNTIYTSRFAKYSADLKKYVSKDLIDSYSKGIASKIGYYKDKLVGLPLYVDVGVLFSNRELIDKYNQTLPKTWNELIDSAEYIVEKEKEIGNNDIIGYIGHMPDGESSICSSLEFIYSFRDSIESDMPGFRSDNALRAFKMIKEIKNKLSSDSNFILNDMNTAITIISGKVVFGKFWYGEYGDLYISQLPGEKAGVSASCVGGRNLIVNNYVSEERKIASAKVIEFLLSKKLQIKYVLENGKHSGLDDVYYDEELCSKYKCEPFRNMQFIPRPSPSLMSYDEYSLKYISLFTNYLYGNETAENTLKQIDYLTSIYYIENNSTIGRTVIFVTSSILFIMFFTYIIVLSNKYKIYFCRYNKMIWSSMFVGLFIYISQNYFLIGELTEL
ncbi:periplasmic binding protein-like II, partial [Anaeromyces robustus]